MCLSCRVILPAGNRCDISARHEVVDLSDTDGRKALQTAVWNAPRMRRFVSPETRVLVGGIAGAGVILSAVVFGPLAALIALIAIVVGPGLLFAVYALISRSYRPALPQGTSSQLLLPWRRSRRGIVHAEKSITAPISGRQCIAFVVCYRSNDYYAGDTMLVDCATGAFSVTLDDGREVDVPAGSIRLEVPSNMTINDRARISQHLDSIASELDSDRQSTRPTLPYDSATEGLLVDGNRIELFCKLSEVAMSYRETAKRLVPVSVPRVRVLADDAGGARYFENS